jgi:c-di-GMP-binding flagellar brake protein YcgR
VDALDAILKANDLVEVIGREISVRLVDISVSGCLLESSHRIEKGTTGSLSVVFEGTQYLDDIRVIRCRENEGSSSLYFLGAEFLWTTSPHQRSLRRILASLQASAFKTARLDSPKM